jgi:hypothetical protein
MTDHPAVRIGGTRLTLATVALVAAGYTLLAVVLTWPQVTLMAEGVASHGDPLFSLWRLKWFARQLVTDPETLFDGNIFHPDRGTLANSDATFLEAALAAPVLWAGVPAILVYNILLIGGIVSSGVAMFVLARRLSGHFGGAFIAGLVFAFAPYRIEHYMHLELQWAQWMPLSLWALHRTLETGRLRDGLLTGLFVLLQFLSSVYYGLFLATFLVAVGGLLVAFQRRAPLARVVGALAIGALLTAVVVVPYSRPYRANAERLGDRADDEIRWWSAKPYNYLAAPETNLLYGRVTQALGGAETRLLPGLTVLLLFIAAWLGFRDRRKLIYLVGLLLMFDFSLGLNGLIYPWFLEHGSPFRGLRAPARFGILVNLVLALFAAWGVVQVVSRMRAAWARRAVPVVVGVLLIVEYWSAPLAIARVAPPPPVYKWLAQQPPSVVIELPVPSPSDLPGYEQRYEYYSTFHWQRLVNGYSGYYPERYLRLIEKMRWFPSGASIEALADLDVRYIVIHEELFPSNSLNELAAAMGIRDAFFTFVGRFPDVEGSAQVYELTWKRRDREKRVKEAVIRSEGRSDPGIER